MKNLVLVLIGFLIISCQADKLKISEWRGLNRAGIYSEDNLLKNWGEDEPKLKWFHDSIGNGYGSPVFVDNELFITGEIDSMAYLLKFNTDGKLLWKSIYGKEWTGHFPGSRISPTIINDLVYVTSGTGDIVCLNKEDGNIVWSVNSKEKYGGYDLLFGYSESPAILGDKLFFMPGGKDHYVIALNRFTGEEIWSCNEMDDRASYCSPLVIQLENRNILVHFSSYYLVGIDADTGKLLWTHEQTNTKPDERKPGNGDTHANTVLYDNGFIYYAAGDGNCGVCLQLSANGDSITEVWKNSSFDNYMGGIVKIGNSLYGGGTRKKYLKVADIETGEITDSLKIGSGSIIAADNKLYFYNQKGEVHLVDYANNKLKSVSSFKVEKGTKEHFAHPVIHQGVLYIRHGQALMAYDIRGNS